MRASSASELAPQPVQAGSGALNVKGYGLWWNNGNFHRGTLSSEADDNHNFHCFAPFSCRSALQPSGGSYLCPKSSELAWHPKLKGGVSGIRPPLPSLSPLLYRFFNVSLLGKPIQNSVDCRQRVAVFRKTAAQLIEFIPHVAGRKRPVRRCHDLPHVVRQSRIYQLTHPGVCVIREIALGSLMFRDEDDQRIHFPAKNKNPFFNTGVFLEQAFQFAGRCLVVFSILRVRHVSKFTPELSRCKA